MGGEGGGEHFERALLVHACNKGGPSAPLLPRGCAGLLPLPARALIADTRSQQRRRRPHRRPCDADSGRSSSRSAPRWTVPEAASLDCRQPWNYVCPRNALQGPSRHGMTWKKGKLLLARAPKAREKFVSKDQIALRGPRGRAYLHRRSSVHQDADTHGVAGATLLRSLGPADTARVTFFGAYVYNDRKVGIWPAACWREMPRRR
jgi:hypothetical protein